MAQLPPPATLPSSLAAMVESYNDLVPGIVWNDSVVDAMLVRAAANASSCKFHVHVVVSSCKFHVHVVVPPHDDAEVELEIHSPLCICRHTPGRASVSVYWSLPDTTVWEGTRPATKEGLLELLLEARRIIRCIQRGPCAECLAKTPPDYSLRLTPGDSCLSCVLASFFLA